MLGIVIAIGSWGFHVAALALAPISLVQSVIAGGLVLLTVVADRLFAHEVTRREWIGVGLAALGLAFLAASIDGSGSGAHSDYEAATLAIFLGVGHRAGDRRRGGRLANRLTPASRSAPPPGSSGPSPTPRSRPRPASSARASSTVFVSPLVLLIIVASFVGLTVSAKSLQIGKAVPVIAMTTVAANALTILSGPIVFGDPVPEDALGFAARMLAFVLVLGAAALTPAPVRAAEAT